MEYICFVSYIIFIVTNAGHPLQMWKLEHISNSQAWFELVYTIAQDPSITVAKEKMPGL